MPDLSEIDVIAPNFKKRMSGVSSTVIRLVPIQARSIGIVTSGPKSRLPDDVPQVPFAKLLTMSARGPSGHRVWHARRNSEMLVGIVLKHVLRKKLKLLFTSAAQRDHSGYTKWLLRQMDHVIATSAKSAQYLEVPHHVIHHGIDTDVFHPVPDKSALRASLGLPASGPLIGCFGRIRPQKGNDIFIDAMVRVLPKHPRVVAVMMGGVADKDKAFLDGLKQQAHDAGLADRILFLPEAPDFQITGYFQALDLYIAPQRWEGFGLTPLEAMSCAVPAIATRVGAFEDLIKDGETGRLVDIEDTAAIADATDTVLQDLRLHAQWSAASRSRATEHFSITKEAAAITSVYRDLLSRT